MKIVERRTLEAWRGDTLGLSLKHADLELVDNVLCVVPEVRVVAFLGREARKRRLKYPVTSAARLGALLSGDSFVLGGHRVTAKTIAHALPKQWFPLHHEGDLLSAIHLALHRCKAEAKASFVAKLKARRATTHRTATRPATGEASAKANNRGKR